MDILFYSNTPTVFIVMLSLFIVCLLALVPATGGGYFYPPQCSFSRKSPTKQWIKTVSFRDIVTHPFGFLTPVSVVVGRRTRDREVASSVPGRGIAG